MTAALTPPAATGRESSRPPYKVTFPRVLRSEWGKFWSVRSSWITLGVALLLLLLVGIIAAAVYTPDGGGSDVTDGAVGLALQGVTFAELALGVLGVMMAAGEYTTGMIRATLAAVPKRLPVLW